MAGKLATVKARPGSPNLIAKTSALPMFYPSGFQTSVASLSKCDMFNFAHRRIQKCSQDCISGWRHLGQNALGKKGATKKKKWLGGRGGR